VKLDTIALVMITAAALMGCASGPVTGRVSITGQEPAPLTMSWESGLLGDSGTMAAVMPDGERFSGKYTVVKKGAARGRIDPAWEGDEPSDARGEIDDSMWGAARDRGAFVTAHSEQGDRDLEGRSWDHHAVPVLARRRGSGHARRRRRRVSDVERREDHREVLGDAHRRARRRLERRRP
jgi:hypothetical protein